MSEKRLLQTIFAIACLVPLTAGMAGVLLGSGFLESSHNLDMDSHFRYLSGLLLGIGLGFVSSLPHIERHSARVSLLTFIVVIGGVARLIGLLFFGLPSLGMILALGMELVVTPLLCLWQRRVARRFHS